MPKAYILHSYLNTPVCADETVLIDAYWEHISLNYVFISVNSLQNNWRTLVFDIIVQLYKNVCCSCASVIRDRVVGIVSRIQAEQPWNCGSIPGRSKRSFCSPVSPDWLTFFPVNTPPSIQSVCIQSLRIWSFIIQGTRRMYISLED